MKHLQGIPPLPQDARITLVKVFVMKWEKRREERVGPPFNAVCLPVLLLFACRYECYQGESAN